MKSPRMDKVLPSVIAERAQVQRQVCHRADGYPWSQHAVGQSGVLDDVGIPMPKTWEELIASADKTAPRANIPLALGGQSWQEIFVFESIIVDVGGRDLLTKVAYDLDDAALRGPKC